MPLECSTCGQLVPAAHVPRGGAIHTMGSWYCKDCCIDGTVASALAAIAPEASPSSDLAPESISTEDLSAALARQREQLEQVHSKNLQAEIHRADDAHGRELTRVRLLLEESQAAAEQARSDLRLAEQASGSASMRDELNRRHAEALAQQERSLREEAAAQAQLLEERAAAREAELLSRSREELLALRTALEQSHEADLVREREHGQAAAQKRIAAAQEATKREIQALDAQRAEDRAASREAFTAELEATLRSERQAQEAELRSVQAQLSALATQRDEAATELAGESKAIALALREWAEDAPQASAELQPPDSDPEDTLILLSALIATEASQREELASLQGELAAARSSERLAIGEQARLHTGLEALLASDSDPTPQVREATPHPHAQLTPGQQPMNRPPHDGRHEELQPEPAPAEGPPFWFSATRLAACLEWLIGRLAGDGRIRSVLRSSIVQVRRSLLGLTTIGHRTASGLGSRQFHLKAFAALYGMVTLSIVLSIPVVI